MKGERKRGVVRRSKGWHIYDSESGESSYSFTGRILEGRHTRPYVNPRPAGGGAFERPPSGFSRIAKKRRRAAPPGFHPPYPPSIPQLL